MSGAEIYPTVIVVAREEVESGHLSDTLEALNQLIISPEIAREYKESIDIWFHGYDEDKRELWEIDEVRTFVQMLDEAFPYWLFFLSKSFWGLSCIALCLLPPFLTEQGKREVFPSRIYDLIERHWGPAAMKISAFANVSEPEVDHIIIKSASYFSEGRLF